jgi:hypothetical protein
MDLILLILDVFIIMALWAIGNRVLAISDYLLERPTTKPTTKPPIGLLDLPNRQVTYKDTFMMGNWDGVSPLPDNFDGVDEEEDEEG